MTKIAGSGSISQRHGSADPDPDPPQNVMDPQHCSYHQRKMPLASQATHSLAVVRKLGCSAKMAFANQNPHD